MKQLFDTIDNVLVHRLENGGSWENILSKCESLEDVPVRVLHDRVDARGTFSDREIRVGLALGHIVCDPYPTHINGSSIDVTLGHNFYTAGEGRPQYGLYNPFDEQDNTAYFGDAKIAKPYAEVRSKILKDMGRRRAKYFEETMHLENISEDHPIIALRPGERILGHTNEFIGILPPGTTSMQARSTTGRMGVAACLCAGWGDPGFVNRWAMEVNNLNENEYVPLPVGYRIAQIVFSATGPVDKEYASTTGKYQATSGHDLATIQRNWRPEHMLPRAYKDDNSLPLRPDNLADGIL